MTTQPHQNSANGYSLRIGKHLPKHAANLAYVHTDTPRPDTNIIVNDLTEAIPENSLRLDEQDEMETFINPDGFLETTNGILELGRPDVLVTNEYTLDDRAIPLFYRHRSRYLFDARRALVSQPLSGRRTGRMRIWDEFAPDDSTQFILHSEQVVITRPGGTERLSTEGVKIMLEKAGEEDYLYRLVVYTSFDGVAESYELHYPAHGHKIHHKETVNPEAVFSEYQSQSNLERTRSYQVEAQPSGKYRIKLPTEDNQFLITDEHRPPHTFQYQLNSHIKTRISDKNPLEVNIGLIYINDTVINATRVTSVLRKLVQDNPFMPDYLSFKNPHRKPGYHDPKDVLYWEADLTMPREHWMDYDVLIITGYGDRNFTNAADNIRSYLDTGGILLFDSAGEGSQVLNPITQQGIQTFVANISYSSTETEAAHRQFTSEASMKDRYYDVKNEERIGRIAPVIRFHGEENIDDWQIFLQHANGGPALMRKKTGSIGQLVVSNMGWMLDALFGGEHAMRFFTNFLLHCLEDRSFVSPVFNEHVYHKDDLYADEYRKADGTTLYYDDRSDEDSSQIVAKKVLYPTIDGFAQRFLPQAYRRYQSATFNVSVNDSGEIPVANNGFELTSTDGATEWEQSTEDALPGFDFVRFSGTSTRGEQTTHVHRSGRRSLMVETIDAQGFFEQDLGTLPEGDYHLNVYIRGESTGGGGAAIYDMNGEFIAGTGNMSGTFNWRQEHINFTLSEAQPVFLRLGAYEQNQNTKLFFDDVTLKTTSVIRMNQPTAGGDILYAYATTPKGKNNQLNHHESRQTAQSVLAIDAEVSGTISVKSYVYQWFSAEGRFKKQYGNHKQSRFTLTSSQGEHTLGVIQSFLPALQSGAEWARKDRVYYELSLEPDSQTPYINLSLYDPSVDQYFYTPEGEWVLNHEDIWWNGFDATVQVRGELGLYHMQATGNQYLVKPKPEQQIRVRPPRTQDERDRWYLAIQNGTFQKEALHVKDQEDVSRSGRHAFYHEFLSGEHEYALPEYRRQSFYPRMGERLIEQELAEYRDEYKIRVHSTPLLIREEDVVRVPMTVVNSEKTVWNSPHIHWDRQTLPRIYVDEWSDGNLSLWTSGFEIDYSEGMVRFDQPVDGLVYASYRHDNFVITRRRYANNKITGELMRSRDNYTFEMERPNVALSPAPVFYRGTRLDEAIIPPSSYRVDYQSGTVTFFEETRVRIYADYLYFEEDELEWADANRQTGDITLTERVSFKDEITVTYVAEENHHIYKGYYDEELNTFMHLDLNPTAGHTYSMKREIQTGWDVVEAESEKLLNKEIYLYLLPKHSLYYKHERTEDHTVRHVFEEEGWMKVKAARPDAVLLATVHVRENTSPEHIVVMDARRSGGGLKETVSQESIERRVGYTSAFWDIGSFDGMAYYKNGVTVVRIPSKVLTDNGGQFTQEQVKTIVHKFLALGTYPLIEYTEEDDA